MYDREYEYVAAIAKAGTLSGAAAELGVSQPALTHFLKKEESELGTAIFQRIGNRMTLTYAGECYMENIEQILAIQTRMRVQIQDIARMDHGRLRVGVPTIRRPFTIFSVIPRFKSKYPAIDLNLIEESSVVLEKKLSELELDCIVVNVSRRKDEFEYMPVYREQYVLAVHKDSPLLNEAKKVEGKRYPVLPLEKLENAQFILLEKGQRIRQFTDSVLEGNKVKYQISMHARSLESALEAVACGLGCTFTPEVLRRYNRGGEDVRFLTVENIDSDYEFCLVHRKGAFLPPSTTYFMELFRNTFVEEKMMEEND